MATGMTLASVIRYCLRKKGAVEDYPFGPEVCVMKVGGKMFALFGITARPLGINLKCDPFLAMDLRERYAAVEPGYHMNKVHWNTVTLDGSIPRRELLAMIDHSYDLVLKSLSVKRREAILIDTNG